MMCREFDSLMDRHSPLAQLVEQLRYMERVAGSSPAGTTINVVLDEWFKSSPFQGENHGFESRTRYNKCLISSVGLERLICTQKVVGSIPT